jgi:hypothetical protein
MTATEKHSSEVRSMNFLQIGSDEPTNVWVHRIVHRAMAASKAGGADLTTQRATAVRAVCDVHPHLSREDVLAAVYSEGRS